MAINDTVQLAVKGTWMNNDHIHTLHFRFLDPTANEADLINAWEAGAKTQYLAIFPTGHHVVKIVQAAQVCGSLPLRAAVEEAFASGAGTGTRATATEHLASWLASLTRERTASAGRSHQGRFFLGGLTEADVISEDLQAAYITPTTAYLTALLAVFGPSGTNNLYRLVVHSRKLAAVPGSQCQNTSTVVTNLQLHTKLTSQRSRRTGSGM